MQQTARKQAKPVRIEDGQLINQADKVLEAYKAGAFYYQFVRKDGRSRVMTCSSQSECDWIAGNLNKGARVVIERAAEAVERIRPAVYTALNGERVTSADKLRRMLAKGSFSYQLKKGGCLSAIETCDDEISLEYLIDTLSTKTEIVVRQ